MCYNALMLKFGVETMLKGLPISGGVARARACRFNEKRHSNVPRYRVEGKGVAREISRLERAVALTGSQIEELRETVAREIGDAEAGIFAAQKAVLMDGVLQKEMFHLIKEENSNAEGAVASVLDSYELRLSEMDSEYIRERATDMGEIKRRLLDVLGNINPALQCGGAEHCHKGRSRIVMASELTPRLTLDLDTENTLGFVTERGGVTSHAAILARAMGIPAVTGIKNIHEMISCGTEVLVDGDAGEIVVCPSEETLAKYPSVRVEPAGQLEAVGPVEGLRVLANISLSSDTPLVLDMQAEGIGLYRTEFEFMAAERVLNEDEQYERYVRVVKQMKGRTVYFRLLDIGGDKQLSFLDIPEEENPYLGFRGARYLLGRPEMVQPQARAIGRASMHGPVSVMYPMIVDLAQFRRLRKLFEDAISGIETGTIKHGVMFEVPSACIQAEELLEEADFGSIGSNDLIQYLFAVDRNNDLVAYDYTPEHQVLWSVLKQIADASAKTGKEISICGELASDPQYIARLMELGISTLSVSPRLISAVRRAAKAVGS